MSLWIVYQNHQNKKKYIISLHQMYLFVMFEKLEKYTYAAIIIQFYN